MAIAVPLVLAALVQLWSAQSKTGKRLATALGVLPVPVTALVLFVVIASVVPQLEAATDAALRVVPIYIAFAIIAPLIGWHVGRLFGLDILAGRSIAFSTKFTCRVAACTRCAGRHPCFACNHRHANIGRADK